MTRHYYFVSPHETIYPYQYDTPQAFARANGWTIYHVSVDPFLGTVLLFWH